MTLKEDVISLLEVSRTHETISGAMEEANQEGRLDIKTVITILGMALDHLDEKSSK